MKLSSRRKCEDRVYLSHFATISNSSVTYEVVKDYKGLMEIVTK